MPEGTAVTLAVGAACTACGRRVRLPPADDVPPRCPDCHSVLPWLTVAGDDELDAALTCSWPVLVNFWSLGQDHPRFVAPVLIEVARQHAGRLKAVSVDVDHAPRSSATFGVEAVPSLYVVRNRLVLAHRAGAVAVDRLLDWIEHSLARG